MTTITKLQLSELTDRQLVEVIANYDKYGYSIQAKEYAIELLKERNVEEEYIEGIAARYATIKHAERIQE